MGAPDRPDQVMDEVSSCLRMLDEVYEVFGLTYKAALSTRPDSYLGTLEQWDAAEAALKQALDATGKGWEVRLHLRLKSCTYLFRTLNLGSTSPAIKSVQGTKQL